MIPWIILGAIVFFIICFFVFIWGNARGIKTREHELHAEMVFLRSINDELRKDNEALENRTSRLEDEIQDFT
jgi:cell division protein FtsB